MTWAVKEFADGDPTLVGQFIFMGHGSNQICMQLLYPTFIFFDFLGACFL